MSSWRWQIGCTCCSPFGQVLNWYDNQGLQPMEAIDYYLSLGVQVDEPYNWSGNLLDYKLVFWSAPTIIPSWWPLVTGNQYLGRIHFIGEYNFFYSPTFWNSNLAPVIGMSLGTQAIDPGCIYGRHCPNTGDPLAGGASYFCMAATNEIIGGTPISRTVTGSKTWLAHVQPFAGLDFVASGDSNHLNGCGYGLPGGPNFPFVEALLSLPP